MRIVLPYTPCCAATYTSLLFALVLTRTTVVLSSTLLFGVPYHCVALPSLCDSVTIVPLCSATLLFIPRLGILYVSFSLVDCVYTTHLLQLQWCLSTQPKRFSLCPVYIPFTCTQPAQCNTFFPLEVIPHVVPFPIRCVPCAHLSIRSRFVGLAPLPLWLLCTVRTSHLRFGAYCVAVYILPFSSVRPFLTVFRTTFHFELWYFSTVSL